MFSAILSKNFVPINEKMSKYAIESTEKSLRRKFERDQQISVYRKMNILPAYIQFITMFGIGIGFQYFYAKKYS